MDKRLPHHVRAKRHRLLADERRLAIVEALSEAPRQIPELARLLGIHPTTVRSHLEKLLEAGVLEEEAGVSSGRGRPAKRYRLLHPLLGGAPELRLVVDGMVSLLRAAYGDQALAAAEGEGVKKGRELGRALEHPSPEQTARQVSETLTRLSFAPGPVVRKKDALSMDLRHCPFRIEPTDPDGALVCAFHGGLIRGLAEASGEALDVRVVPFVAPGVCRVEMGPQGNGPTAQQRGRGPKASRGTARRPA